MELGAGAKTGKWSGNPFLVHDSSCQAFLRLFLFSSQFSPFSQALFQARKASEIWRRLRWHVCRVNLARFYFFELRIFLRKILRNFPEMFEPLFCGSEKIPQNSRHISHQISLRKIKKIHRRASAGAQGERRGHWKMGICMKLSEIDFQILWHFLRTLPLILLRKFGAQFATNLRSPPPLANAPFSGFLKLEIILFRLVAHLFSRLSCLRLRGSLPRYSEGVEHTWAWLAGCTRGSCMSGYFKSQWAAKEASGKGGHVKRRQNVKERGDKLRYFSTFLVQGTSKIVENVSVKKTFSAIFVRHQFFSLSWGPLIKKNLLMCLPLGPFCGSFLAIFFLLERAQWKLESVKSWISRGNRVKERLSVLKRCVPKTLAFAFGLRLRSNYAVF